MCLTSIDVFCCYSLMEVLSSIGTKEDSCSILCKTQLHDCSLIFKLNFKAYPVRVCWFVWFVFLFFQSTIHFQVHKEKAVSLLLHSYLQAN